MSSIHGQLTICDRCGKTVFLNHIGNGEADGGFTRFNKFEPLPKGWDYTPGIGMMCPKCNEAYKNLLDGFMKDKVENE